MDDPKQVSSGIHTDTRTCCSGYTPQVGYLKEFLQLRKTAGRGQWDSWGDVGTAKVLDTKVQIWDPDWRPT